MKKNGLLLPHRLKVWGWILTIPSLVTGIWFMAENSAAEYDLFDFEILAVVGEGEDGFFGGDPALFVWMNNNLLDELVGALLMIGLLLLCFTREKTEDEYIARIRSESFQWAVFVQMVLYLVALLTIYGLPFWTFMLINLYLLPIVFVVRYYYKMYQLNRLS